MAWTIRGNGGWLAWLILAGLGLSACGKHDSARLPGTLEWDRVAVLCEVSEPVAHIAVTEGQTVKAGDLILSLDPRRTDAQLASAMAREREAKAIARQTAHDLERVLKLRALDTLAPADEDRARAAADSATASVGAARAETEELRLRRARLDVRAPADGRVDALPFKLGDQPPQGAVLVSLLAGRSPYARLHIPAPQRAMLAAGDTCTLTVTGRSEKFNARMRSIEAEPSFTPYYALTGDDASRLVYRAEAVLTDEAAATLAAGLPVEATCQRRAN